MLDLVEALRAANAGRDPQRLKMKWRRMRESPFVFFRGSCALFYQRLPLSQLPPVAPVAWLCGDLHLENFGAYKGDNRQVYVDINDFDEAALGPVTWDLVRLLTSVQVAAGALRVKRAEALQMCTDLLKGYAAALRAGKAGWLERETAPGLLGEMCRELQGRKRAALLARYTVLDGGERRLQPGKRLEPALAQSQATVRSLVAAAQPAGSPPGFFDVLDVAHRITGTGSLGLARYIVLLRGKGGPEGHYLLDVKQAMPSALRPPDVVQPIWLSEAHRVVALQQRLQAMPAAFLHAVVSGPGAYVLRGLQPTDDRVVIEASRPAFEHIAEVAADLGRLLAWAQLRSACRQGSDTTDDLIVFGAARSIWQTPLLETAALCAEQTLDDWQAFERACKQGAFGAI